MVGETRPAIPPLFRLNCYFIIFIYGFFCSLPDPLSLLTQLGKCCFSSPRTTLTDVYISLRPSCSLLSPSSFLENMRPPSHAHLPFAADALAKPPR